MRGLKFFNIPVPVLVLFVAPLAGAWIEMSQLSRWSKDGKVAPLAGAWIEIVAIPVSWLRSEVAPLAGAWIEMNRTDR